jgi:hypothetical protein
MFFTQNLTLPPKFFSGLSLIIICIANIVIIPPILTIQLSDEGLFRLDEARNSGTGQFPDWFDQELTQARAETK